MAGVYGLGRWLFGSKRLGLVAAALLAGPAGFVLGATLVRPVGLVVAVALGLRAAAWLFLPGRWVFYGPSSTGNALSRGASEGSM